MKRGKTLASKTIAIAIPTQEEAQQAVDRLEASYTIPEVPVILSTNDYVSAANALKEIKAMANKLETERKTITRPMDEAKKAVMALFDPPLTRLSNRENAIKMAILEWNREIERRRQIEQAKLDEARRLEEAKAQKRADKLLAKGKVEQAEAVIANVPPASIVVMDTEKVKGITERTTWKAMVVDFDKLVGFCVEHDTYDFLLPNLSLLNKYAVSMKGNTKIPGVSVYEEKGIAAGKI